MKNRLSSSTKSLRSHKRTMLLIAITVVATLIVSTLISMWLRRISDIEIPSIGTIAFEDVEGYWDENLTRRIGPDASYDWGLTWPGAATNLTLYLRSVSSVDTKFVLKETDWTFYNSSGKAVQEPSNSPQFMWMTWDYDNATVHPGQVLKVTLTLHAESSSSFIEFVIADDVKSFSFDILISTSENN